MGRNQKPETRCNIDSRVADEYIQVVTCSYADMMRNLHEYRLKRGHVAGMRTATPIRSTDVKYYANNPKR